MDELDLLSNILSLMKFGQCTANSVNFSLSIYFLTYLFTYFGMQASDSNLVLRHPSARAPSERPGSDT